MNLSLRGLSLLLFGRLQIALALRQDEPVLDLRVSAPARQQHPRRAGDQALAFSSQLGPPVGPFGVRLGELGLAAGGGAVTFDRVDVA